MQDNLYELDYCYNNNIFPPPELEEKLSNITNDGFDWYHTNHEGKIHTNFDDLYYEIWGRIFITIPPERKIWFILKYGSIVLCK